MSNPTPPFGVLPQVSYFELDRIYHELKAQGRIITPVKLEPLVFEEPAIVPDFTGQLPMMLGSKPLDEESIKHLLAQSARNADGAPVQISNNSTVPPIVSVSSSTPHPSTINTPTIPSTHASSNQAPGVKKTSSRTVNKAPSQFDPILYPFTSPAPPCKLEALKDNASVTQYLQWAGPLWANIRDKHRTDYESTLPKSELKAREAARLKASTFGTSDGTKQRKKGYERDDDIYGTSLYDSLRRTRMKRSGMEEEVGLDGSQSGADGEIDEDGSRKDVKDRRTQRRKPSSETQDKSGESEAYDTFEDFDDNEHDDGEVDDLSIRGWTVRFEKMRSTLVSQVPSQVQSQSQSQTQSQSQSQTQSQVQSRVQSPRRTKSEDKGDEKRDVATIMMNVDKLLPPSLKMEEDAIQDLIQLELSRQRSASSLGSGSSNISSLGLLVPGGSQNAALSKVPTQHQTTVVMAWDLLARFGTRVWESEAPLALSNVSLEAFAEAMSFPGRTPLVDAIFAFFLRVIARRNRRTWSTKKREAKDTKKTDEKDKEKDKDDDENDGDDSEPDVDARKSKEKDKDSAKKQEKSKSKSKKTAKRKPKTRGDDSENSESSSGSEDGSDSDGEQGNDENVDANEGEGDGDAFDLLDINSDRSNPVTLLSWQEHLRRYIVSVRRIKFGLGTQKMMTINPELDRMFLLPLSPSVRPEDDPSEGLRVDLMCDVSALLAKGDFFSLSPSRRLDVLRMVYEWAVSCRFMRSAVDSGADAIEEARKTHYKARIEASASARALSRHLPAAAAFLEDCTAFVDAVETAQIGIGKLSDKPSKEMTKSKHPSLVMTEHGTAYPKIPSEYDTSNARSRAINARVQLGNDELKRKATELSHQRDTMLDVALLNSSVKSTILGEDRFHSRYWLLGAIPSVLAVQLPSPITAAENLRETVVRVQQAETALKEHDAEEHSHHHSKRDSQAKRDVERNRLVSIMNDAKESERFLVEELAKAIARQVEGGTWLFFTTEAEIRKFSSLLDVRGRREFNLKNSLLNCLSIPLPSVELVPRLGWAMNTEVPLDEDEKEGTDDKVVKAKSSKPSPRATVPPPEGFVFGHYSRLCSPAYPPAPQLLAENEESTTATTATTTTTTAATATTTTGDIAVKPEQNTDLDSFSLVKVEAPLEPSMDDEVETLKSAETLKTEAETESGKITQFAFAPLPPESADLRSLRLLSLTLDLTKKIMQEGVHRGTMSNKMDDDEDDKSSSAGPIPSLEQANSEQNHIIVKNEMSDQIDTNQDETGENDAVPCVKRMELDKSLATSSLSLSSAKGVVEKQGLVPSDYRLSYELTKGHVRGFAFFEGEQLYRCIYCQSVFCNENIFHCSLCHKQFNSKSTYSRHTEACRSTLNEQVIVFSLETEPAPGVAQATSADAGAGAAATTATTANDTLITETPASTSTSTSTTASASASASTETEAETSNPLEKEKDTEMSDKIVDTPSEDVVNTVVKSEASQEPEQDSTASSTEEANRTDANIDNATVTDADVAADADATEGKRMVDGDGNDVEPDADADADVDVDAELELEPEEEETEESPEQTHDRLVSVGEEAALAHYNWPTYEQSHGISLETASPSTRALKALLVDIEAAMLPASQKKSTLSHRQTWLSTLRRATTIQAVINCTLRLEENTVVEWIRPWFDSEHWRSSISQIITPYQAAVWLLEFERALAYTTSEANDITQRRKILEDKFAQPGNVMITSIPREYRKKFPGITPISMVSDDYDVLGCCQVCYGQADDSHNQELICDGCDDVYHMYCLNPPLDTVPTGQFYCAACMKLKRKSGIRSLFKFQPSSKRNQMLKQREKQAMEQLVATGQLSGVQNPTASTTNRKPSRGTSNDDDDQDEDDEDEDDEDEEDQIVEEPVNEENEENDDDDDDDDDEEEEEEIRAPPKKRSRVTAPSTPTRSSSRAAPPPPSRTTRKSTRDSAANTPQSHARKGTRSSRRQISRRVLGGEDSSDDDSSSEQDISD